MISLDKNILFPVLPRSTIACMILTCLVFKATSVCAQGVQVNLYSAYVFDDKFDSYYDNSNYYDGKILGGYQWGAGVEYLLRPEYSVELLYLRQKTRAPTEYAENGLLLQKTDFDVGINYILLGGARRLVLPNQKVEAFGGGMAGVVLASLNNPDSGREATATKFSWGAKAGGIIWPTEHVGIKIQAQILSAVQAMGGGFYFGTGGPGAGLTSYSTIYQFSLGGGVVFKLKLKP